MYFRWVLGTVTRYLRCTKRLTGGANSPFVWGSFTRYDSKSTLITTNTVYKKWTHIFNNDSILASAILDRLLHHCETIIIEGKSYRTQKEEVPINR
ncbi:MAG: ATP-binding protein [Lentisphaerae bacterium]|nr:ATP-binding protein [Lentisphaerota bacterium]